MLQWEFCRNELIARYINRRLVCTQVISASECIFLHILDAAMIKLLAIIEINIY